MKYALIALAVLGLFGALVYGAWVLEESSKSVKTVVVENGKDAIFTVNIQTAQGATLVIHCSEEEYQEAFSYFLKFLGVEDVPLTCPGGPMWLAYANVDVIPEDIAPAKRAFLELVRSYVPRRIILIAHSDCFIYDVVGAWEDRRAQLQAQQRADLRSAKTLLEHWFRGVQVEMYYGEKVGAELRFNPVPAVEPVEEPRPGVATPGGAQQRRDGK